MRTTHTYAILEIAPDAHAEISAKLKAAAYDHAFHADGVVDMHGIALKAGGGEAAVIDRTLLRGYEQRVEQLEREIEAVKPVVRAAREVVLGHRELGRDLAELVEALSRVRLWKVDR